MVLHVLLSVGVLLSMSCMINVPVCSHRPVILVSVHVEVSVSRYCFNVMRASRDDVSGNLSIPYCFYFFHNKVAVPVQDMLHLSANIM